MAKKSFNERVPAFKWIFLLALIVSVPVTLWSLTRQTQTQSNAYSVTCTLDPAWSDYPTSSGANSLTYKLNLKNNCPNQQYISFSLSSLPSGWKYSFTMSTPSTCSGTLCYGIFAGYQTRYLHVTVTRPSTARLGTYYFTLRAKETWNNNFSASKTLRYIVTN